ncbi:hypothetical protein AB0K48_07455 [Nonomuraea sp. NPDC055795]
MHDEIIARYSEMLDEFDSETLTLTVTIPDAGTLTAENALERMGFNLTLTHRPAPGDIPDPGDLVFVQLPTGVITIDGLSPNDARKEITDRLAGPGYRHWYLSWELGETARLYCRYGDAEGDLLHPEPVDVPFTDWTDHLGPVGPYADLFRATYNTEEHEAQLDIEAVCLTVLELETGIAFTEDLLSSASLRLPAAVLSD